MKILKGDKVHLQIDGTYFDQFCLMPYQDYDQGHSQLIRFSDGEHYSEIKEDLDNLIALGPRIESITTDGHKGMLKAIRKSMPDVVAQRCLVHIQRMCLLWLTRYPRSVAGTELRSLVLQLLKIKTGNDRRWWTHQLEGWHKRHYDYLKERGVNEKSGRYWYTTSCSGVPTTR